MPPRRGAPGGRPQGRDEQDASSQRAHLPRARRGGPGQPTAGRRGGRRPAGRVRARPHPGREPQGRGRRLAHRPALDRRRRGQAAHPDGQRGGRQPLRHPARPAQPRPGPRPVGRGGGQGPVRRLGGGPVGLRPRGRVPRPRRRPADPRRGGGGARGQGAAAGSGRLVPLRPDLRSVLVIGSGPIVIGQAAEFDYSGTQACRALRKLGLRVVLVNSNPATIMTDPEVADATYLEPLTAERVAAVLLAERPDALLPTLGGQTALNLAVELAGSGVLEQAGTTLIGASVEAVERAESRRAFTETCRAAGLATPRGIEVGSLAEGRAAAAELGIPLILRPSYTLGGWGGGVVRSEGELAELLGQGLAASPVRRVLLEESVLGWKEFELEVMRDRADNAVVVCSIENLDPMGVHTGDSVTVAPQMTLSDREYQAMRDESLTVLRAVGVETGGANVQFAVDPASGRRVVIEMNPRVSRSSALASKATGFPIAKVAAQLAVGFTLDEIRNEVTGKTAAAFEPTLDYVVVKVPRFNFEKFPGADQVLTTRMKSVGEVMAIGRTFPEALQKAYRSLEAGRDGLGRREGAPAAGPRADGRAAPLSPERRQALLRATATPTDTRLEEVERAL